jgi:hypothetical protein
VQTTRLQIGGALALATLCAASLAWAAGVSPAVSFVRPGGDALWIASPEPASTGVVAAPFDALPAREFVRRFSLPASAAPLRVRVEALRGFELLLNGRLVARRAWDAGSWRRVEALEIRDGLAAGPNELRVRVRNPSGPPLLRLSADAPGVRLATDRSWGVVDAGGVELPARRADDRLRAPGALGTPGLLDGLRAKRGVLGLAFVAGVLLSLALRAPAGGVLRARLPLCVTVCAALFWLFVFAFRATRLPEYFGFDGPDHLAYVQHVLATASLPLANEGPQTHHPPLFYALSAALLALLHPAGVPPAVALRLVPFASGLVQVGVAFDLGRRLFPGDRLVPAAAALCAALLPVNLVMSSYLGNEPLHAALAALALLAATRALLAARVRAGHAALVGALAGLAILTKVSSLLLVPLTAFFLAAKAWLADGRRLATAGGHALVLVASAGALCGWFFVRNQLLLGRALVGNWDVPGNPLAWWQHPGFHTPAYYLSFGPGLRHPFFASFESFWDGLYSTFWGDGLAGGVSAWSYRHPMWDWDFMGAGYVLALPASALLLLGFGLLVRDALRGPDLRRRAALSLVTTTTAVTVFAVLLLTLVLPAYSMTKASYALSVAAPLALALAVGFARAHRALDAPGWRGLQVVLHGWAGALVAAIVLAFAG